MDVPISLGIVLTLAMSVAQTWRSQEHAYFDGAIMLIFFLLLGRYAEQAMRRRTRDFATNLAALRAESVTLIDPDGSLREAPLSMAKPGDRALVRPGDRIAVDGRILDGVSEIDQSMVTGETGYARLGKGDLVYAGSLNISAALTLEVIAAESGTLIDDVKGMLSRAMDVRARYVRLADRAARLYAPMVHLTSALTFLGWLAYGLAWDQALIIAITVLIITCPCALGLAVPAVQVVAAGSLFKKGVLLNGGEALERLAEADMVVFDKTGTLTLPEPHLSAGAAPDADLLALAGCIALSSRHPLARAIAVASGAKEPLAGAIETPGSGVCVTIDGVEARLGSPQWCDAEAEAEMAALADPTASMIALRHGTRVAVFPVAHRLRPDAIRIVSAIRALGLPMEILSGDREEAVREAADALGIERFSASLTPRGKIDRLEALKAEGRRVLMVGDGLNDAPALAAAHVSISPVTAADVSQAAADAVFLGDRLQPVLTAIETGHRAKALMMQNLWFSVAYNFVAVPIAIAGLATPLVAAIAMSGSSIIVTVNALRRLAGGRMALRMPPGAAASRRPLHECHRLSSAARTRAWWARARRLPLGAEIGTVRGS